nr:lytic polysaccharide monooxygenase [Erwinia mallotivora]
MSERGNSLQSGDNKIVLGFWHNWPSTGGQGYRMGSFTEMTLSEIPVQYNVIAVSFMKVLDVGDRIPDFKPYKGSEAEFRHQIDLVHAQGRKVLISLGGADAHIELSHGDEDALVERIIALTNQYDFDGLDIDLEQAAITAADNQTVIPAALRKVKDHFRQQGKYFTISMAPEFPYLTQGGHYSPYIKNLEGYYDYVAPQYYNQGGDGLWIDGVGWLAQNNDAQKADFLFYLTESLVTGTRNFIKIPHDKFIIGLPTNNDAAATGYVVDPQDVYSALDRLDAAGLPIRGLMTWSVNWDAGVTAQGQPYNWEFINRYGYLAGDGTVPQPSPQPDPAPQPEPSPQPDPAPEPEPSPQPDPVPQPDELPQWRAGVRYSDNDRVSWQSQNYLCVMQHDSNLFWSPDVAHSLWQPALRTALRPGAAADAFTQSGTPALRHGHIATPASRAWFAWRKGQLNAGQLNQREAGKFFPQTARGLADVVAPTDSTNALPPPDGRIASANQGDGLFLDEPGTHWEKHTVSSSSLLQFTWTYTAAHSTRRWNYFITREDWDPQLPLSRAQFEETPFFKVEFTEQPFWSFGSLLRPSGPSVHDVPLPVRSGYHVLLAVWEVADTGNAFYQVIDLDFVGGENPGDTGPVSPAGLHASHVTSDSVSLAWNASVTAGASYRLYCNNTLIHSGSSLSFTDSGLEENTAYTYAVSAVNRAGVESTRSQEMIISTLAAAVPGTTPPTAPSHLHSMAETATSISLMWGASDASNPLQHYLIYREGYEIARVPASQLRYTDVGLSAETTYRYFVAALDSRDLLSVPSNVLSVTTSSAGGSDSGGGDSGLYPQWTLGTFYATGANVSHAGKNWRCLQAHTAWVQDWAPGEAPALWAEIR